MSLPDSEWRAALKPGDKAVAVTGYIGGNIYEFYTVERLTDTQIVATRGSATVRFRKSNGWECGKSFGPTLQPITTEILEEIERRKLRRTLNEVKWTDLPLETMRAVVALLPKQDKPEAR